MEYLVNIRQWVGEGGDFYHFHIFMEVVVVLDKHTSSFKFNLTQLEDEYYKVIVKSLWISYDENSNVLVGIQFLNYQKRVKDKFITCEVDRRKRQDQKIRRIED